jgi:hypothetical protein
VEGGKVRNLSIQAVLHYIILTKLFNGAIYLQNKSLDKDTWVMI